jgi:hypothetical protein
MAVTVPGTTVEAARNALLAAIQAHPTITAQPPDGVSPVLVQLDEPANYDPEDIITVDGARVTLTHAAMVGTGGPNYLEENYTLEVNVSVYRGGDNAALAFKRARQLVDAVNAAVRTDPTLGIGQGAPPPGAGYLIEAFPSRVDWTPHWEENHKGRVVDVRIEIEVKGWL